MKAVGGIALMSAIVSVPPAGAQPLTATEIVQNIEGVWGWPGRSPDGRDRSCTGTPTRIWLEQNGTLYRSQTEGDDTIYESKVGIPESGATEATFIMISYTNVRQASLFGQAVWSLSMPDRDHFIWRELPLGLPMPRMERCGQAKVG